MGKVPDKKCAYCNQEDSVYHRYWECEKFQEERQNVDPTVLMELCNSHGSLAEKGWIPDCPARIPFLRALESIPDTTDDFMPVPCLDPQLPLHLFTDGSGSWPKHPDEDW